MRLHFMTGCHFKIDTLLRACFPVQFGYNPDLSLIILLSTMCIQTEFYSIHYSTLRDIYGVLFVDEMDTY